MNLNGTEYFYVRNAQNDIIGLIDKAGTQVVSYTYDSWGKLISIEGTLKDTVGVKNPYRYRGYRYDSETELYYLQSRYYNPTWGRFINADALIGQTGELLGHNMFAYCKNNPVNRKDDHGFRSSGVIDECGGMSDFELSSSPSFISRAADIITGVLEKITRIPEYESVKTGTFGGGPMEIRGIPSAARQAIKPYEKLAKRISWGVTAVTGLWDAGHIWTANTGLTKEQRLLRIGLKGIGIGMGMIGGALAAPLFASGIAAGATLTGAAYLLAGGAVSYGVGSLLESGESYVSRKLGLGYE